MGMFSPETERLRQLLAEQMTHTTGQSAGGGVTQAKQRMGLVPPWYQTLSGEHAGQGFTEALQMMADQRGDMQIGDTTINPLDFINPMAGATVWHGSPHKFDRFDLSKIGTGEGAQAYGHGLYFADSLGVAETYRDALTVAHNSNIPKIRDINYSPTREELELVRTANKQMSNWLPKSANKPFFRDFVDFYNYRNKISDLDSKYYLENKGKIDSDIAKIEEIKRNNPDAFEDLYGKDYNASDLKRPYLSAYKKANEKVNSSLGGNLYKVDLPDDQIANMLDWDAPLSQQPEAVRKALKPVLEKVRKLDPSIAQRVDAGELTGQGVYKLYQTYRGNNPTKASEGFAELGIPGIRYFDGGSRAAGEGTRNYVVFSDEIPKILERR